MHKKEKPLRSLVAVTKRRHRANGLLKLTILSTEERFKIPGIAIGCKTCVEPLFRSAFQLTSELVAAGRHVLTKKELIFFPCRQKSPGRLPYKSEEDGRPFKIKPLGVAKA